MMTVEENLAKFLSLKNQMEVYGKIKFKWEENHEHYKIDYLNDAMEILEFVKFKEINTWNAAIEAAAGPRNG